MKAWISNMVRNARGDNERAFVPRNEKEEAERPNDDKSKLQSLVSVCENSLRTLNKFKGKGGFEVDEALQALEDELTKLR